MSLTLGHSRPAAAPPAPAAPRETKSVSPGADAFGAIMDDTLAADLDASSALVSTEPPVSTGDHAADSTAGSTSSSSVVHPDPVAADATIPLIPASFPAAFAWDNTAAVVADGTGHSVTSASSANWNALDAAVPLTAAVAAVAATAGTFGVTAGSAASIASAAVATIPALRTPDPAARTIAVALPTGDAGAADPTATTFASVVVAASTAAAQAAPASGRATVPAAAAADALPTAEVTADVTATVATPTTPPPASATSGVVTAAGVPVTAAGAPVTAAGAPVTAVNVPVTAAGGPELAGAALAGAAQAGAAQAGAAQAGAVRNTATLNTAVTIAGASGFAVPDSVRLTGRGAVADTDAVAHSASSTSLAPAASALPTAGPIGLPAVVSTPTTAVVAAPASVNAMPLTAQIMKPLFSLATAAPGEHVLTISVSPDNLGPVTVRAHVTGEGIRVELFAPTDLARDALRVILPDLRRDLAGSGLSAQLNLSSDSQAGDPSATRQPRSEADGRNSDSRSPDGRAPDTPREQRPPQFGSTHTIDVLA